MSFYLKDGELLWPTEANAYDVRSKLPVGTYTVGSDPKRGWFLKPITDFSISGKIYGNTTRQADRIINTFMDRNGATGVLLNGEKGSGKTMLAKLISQKAAAMGISTLVINTPFCGDAFNSFIQSIDEPCIIVFDEFEKVFDSDEQEATLTLLDGVYPTKKLFILTVNDKYRVNQHMRNRPGRIFYMLDFKGLDIEFIEEYCKDNLKNKDYVQQICRLSMVFEAFNFDMLKALVEDMNRYNESPQQALEMLNAKPSDSGALKHNVEIYLDGKRMETDNVYPSFIRGNPISHSELEFRVDVPTGKSDSDGDDDFEYKNIVLTQDKLKKIDPENGKFTYVLTENDKHVFVVTLTRETYKSGAYNWYDAF